MTEQKAARFLVPCAALPLVFSAVTVPAYATPPDVGEQSGAGSTDMTMVWQNPNTEYTGTETGGNNPDGDDADEWGDNLAFSTPSVINFVVKPDGELIAPTYKSIYIQNHSAYGIHVSSLDIDPVGTWSIVANKTAAGSTSNAVWGQIGPVSDQLAWASYLDKDDVTTPAKWGMSAAGAASDLDKLYLSTEGAAANINLDLSSATTFGKIHWYLKAGGQGTPEGPEAGKAFSAYSLEELQFISNDIRENGSSSDYYSGANGFNAYAESGENFLALTLGDDSTIQARLVDASQGKGLVFMMPHLGEPYTPMNSGNSSTAEGGWPASDMRAELNTTGYTNHSGESKNSTLYSTKLQGMKMTVDDKPVTPHAVANSSLGYNGSNLVVTTSDPNELDYFWQPSFIEIYGDWWDGCEYSGNEGCSQFALFRSKGIDADNTAYIPSINEGISIPLRSAHPEYVNYFIEIGNDGYYSSSSANYPNNNVNPCFCL